MPLWWLPLFAPAPAHACSLVGPEPLWVEPDSSDRRAPEPPVVESVELTRGRPGWIEDGRLARTSCDDVGWVTLVVRQPAQDDHGQDDVGYLLELDRGELPEGLVLPEVPWRGDLLVLPWLDVGAVRQTPIQFVLRVTPIDRAANRGEPAYATVAEPSADPPRGCSVPAPRLPSLSILGLLALMVLLGRRAHG